MLLFLYCQYSKNPKVVVPGNTASAPPPRDSRWR